MPSPRRLALLRPLILASITLVLSGCASAPPTPMILAALDCSRVIPPSYRAPVAPVPLPDASADAGDLWDAFDGQTGKLDQANGRSADLVSMADACQAQQAKVLAALTPTPWWKVWGR